MSTPLPQAVAAYFQLSNAADLTSLKHCFTETAIVRDEGREHQGHAAIQAWMAAARQHYRFTTEIGESETLVDAIRVRTRISGNFPGSPVTLDQVFTLSGDRIASLEIKPCP
ncbi:nuclear transport factor 2 family protein [Solidesulfovibrio sp.]